MAPRSKIIAVSGIDSGIGKTMVTGLLARWLHENGRRVITMKMVQTGCSGMSEDLIHHRKLAGLEMFEEDAMGLTCPYVFSVPGPPHLASRLDGRVINTEVIVEAADQLARNYDFVLVEGVGGLFVPLNETSMSIDVWAAANWPAILVTGPRPGSINHTLGSLEALDRRKIPLTGMIYNLDGSRNIDPRIVDDTRRLFADKLAYSGCEPKICDLPDVSCTESYCVDFSILFD